VKLEPNECDYRLKSYTVVKGDGISKRPSTTFLGTGDLVGYENQFNINDETLMWKSFPY